MIDLRNMVLWSIGLIAYRYVDIASPHQINLCPLLVRALGKLYSEAAYINF